MRRAILCSLALGLAGFAPATAQDNTRVIHTPWLALRFEQDGQEVPLIHTHTLETEVYLARAPFTVVLPVRGQDDVYWLAAGLDASLFTDADPDSRRSHDERPELPPYFGIGTGMADTAANSGTLMLNPQGHHHLSGLRLGPDQDRHVFFVSEVLWRDKDDRNVTIPIEQATMPLHVVAWFDEDGDGVMRHGEYEFITLRFNVEEAE
jgi:hypothetical protein